MISLLNEQAILKTLPKYVDGIEQKALSRRISGRSGGGSMVRSIDFDLGLHRLAAAANGGGSGD